MNKKMMTAGLALALGVAWTSAPAMAQTTGEKLENKADRAGDKLERGADKVGDKLHRAADKTESKTERAKDKIDDKIHRTDDKAEDKAERAKGTMHRAGDKAEGVWDKTKDKAADVKDTVKEKAQDVKEKIKSKTSRARTTTRERVAGMSHESTADVRATQQALAAKGMNPGPIDGRMGPKTHAALIDYQKANGLTPTGRMDAETTAKLGVSTASTDTGGSAMPADRAANSKIQRP